MPKVEVQYVEKYEEVPQAQHTDKIVEVQERIIEVPELQLQEVFKSSSIWTCQCLDHGEEMSGDQT